MPASRRPGTAPAGVLVPLRSRPARIERGDRPRAISRRTDGAGDCYTPIRDANEDQIRDSDLIHPGQVLVLRGEDTSDAARTGSAPEETATMIQFTKIVTYVVAAMAALTLVLVVLQTTSMLAGS